MKLHNPNFLALLCSTFLHIILFFAITLLCLQPTTSVPSTNVTDHLALLKFKESINYDPHGILSFWNDSIQFCNWHGITCGRRHQRVTTLQLEAHNLGGTISPYIGNLTFLRAIHLQNNSFYGEIPKEAGHLFRLRDLNLFNNTLGGEIPTSLSNCSELRLMNVSVNKLTGKIPTELGSLTKLISLRVARINQLSGALPENIGHTLPNLQQFLLSENKFFGPIPSSLCNASKLQILDLSNNSFVGSVPKKSNKKPSSIVSNIDLLPTISYKMLHQATNGFSLNNLIGSGSFGSVYKGILEQHERLIAVKVLNLQTKGAPKSFMAECNVLRNVRHQNLLKILSCCSSINYNGDEFKALIFEFMTNGSLDMWLHPMIDSEYQSQNLSFFQRLIIAIDVASTLCYLHNRCEQKIIHCDLKPSNILLDNEMIAHASDFGLARLLTTTKDSSKKHTSTIGLKGSIGYTAPEYGIGGEASTEGDVYSYGVLVLEMFTGRRPTNDMFRDGLNLHNFVKMALPKRLVQIVDPLLLPREATEMGETTATIIAKEKVDNNDDNSKQIDANMQKFLLSIFNIGILCSMESPKKRMSMEEVLKELQLIKNTFVGLGNLRGA
ncbi:probable LRR receptor-like serine/threonine-protein kinase At3g47570 [Quercus lobata]|uniref:probable LRR receptor-like serine/threonine-protein kinase At3g47570 n=1 Tax=Quercus lobata TaxID=97700 RepID=UPI00124780B7|nr:probable LRR receptor-like serine/threonine-protein kinase At3g47570 [Quercus lobata]